MTVRLANPRDEEPLYQLLLELDRENNSFGIILDEERIREYIRFGTERTGGLIGVVDAPDPSDPISIAGSIGVLTCDRYWCARNYHWSVLWFFVRKEYRHGRRYADELMTWASAHRRRFEDALGERIAFVDSPFSRVDLEKKMRWWSKWGEIIGGVFLIR